MSDDLESPNSEKGVLRAIHDRRAGELREDRRMKKGTAAELWIMLALSLVITMLVAYFQT